MRFVATVLIETDEQFKGRKPDSMMVLRYLDKIIHVGNVEENIFRGKAIFNILKSNVSVMNID